MEDRAALEFVSSLANPQGGYANVRNEAASLEATHAAIKAFGAFRVADPKAELSAAFLQNFAGSKDLGELLLIFESVALLGKLDEAWVQDLAASTRTLMESHMVDEGGIMFFEDASSDDAAFNMAATVLAQYVEFEMKDVMPFAQYWLDLQDASTGCFFAGPESSEASMESTAIALRALFALRNLAQKNKQQNFDYERLIDTAGVRRCVALAHGSADSVRATALAQQAAAMASLEELYTVNWKYVAVKGSAVSEDNAVVQGSVLRPQLSLRSQLGGIQGHFEVYARIIVAGASEEPVMLKLEVERDGVYRTAEEFDTGTTLGEVDVIFNIGTNVPTIGYMGFYKHERLRIGYGLNIRDNAIGAATGEAVPLGGAVSAGDTFEFDVHAFSEAGEDALREYKAAQQEGEEAMQLEWALLDSSGVPVFQDVVDAEAQQADSSELPDFHVKYTLDRSDLPPGQLTFSFRIEGTRDDGTSFLHTFRSVHYRVASFMAARQVEIDEAAAAALRFGDSLHAEMLPVVSVDGAALSALDQLERRRFSLDLVAQGGQVVRSAPGSLAEDALEFDLSVPASLELVGEFSLRFSYLALDGERIALHPLSESDGAVAEDVTEFGRAAVVAQLRFEALSEDNVLPGQLVYGEPLSYAFAVYDGLSEASGEQGVPVAGTVWMRVRADPAAPASMELALRPIGTSYRLAHSVSANALPGPSVLSFEAETVDGQRTVLYSQDVNVSGDIESEEFVYSTNSLTSQHTSFLSVFKLRCNGVALTDADLRATAYYNGAPVSDASNLPVGVTASGLYSISFNVPLKQASGGLYTITIARDADPSSTIVDLNIHHDNPIDHKLPVRSEWIAILVLSFLFVRVYSNLPFTKAKKQ